MPESNETKFARIEEALKSFKESSESNFKSLKDKVDETNTKLERDFVTQDQLKLLAQEIRPYKTLTLWLFGILVAETIGLLFYLIRSIITS